MVSFKNRKKMLVSMIISALVLISVLPYVLIAISDVNGYGMIGQAVWEILFLNVNHKVESYLVKNPNCYPLHSQ